MHRHGGEGIEGVVRTDGQPGSYADVDDSDAMALWGHNVAETQTVLWRGCSTGVPARPPRLLAVDPRPTPVAREPTSIWRHATEPTSH